MSSLDARLRGLIATRDYYAERARTADAATTVAVPVIPERVGVLVKFTGAADDLRQAGLELETIVGDETTPFRIAVGTIALDDAGALAEVPHVTRIEMDRPIYPELDVSTVEIKAKPLRTGSSPLTGQNVVVGIVDGGFDYRHHAFRFSSGGSRVLNIWDQSISVRPQRPQDPFQEAFPPEFPGVGVEYTQQQIRVALESKNPLDVVRTTDGTAGHGTHVAGIAAGDGSQAGTKPDKTCTGADTYIGVAPAADIIFVVFAFEANVFAIGRSGNLVKAIRYIFLRASQLDNGAGRPCVINISLGDNLGPHDGTSLVEQAMNLELSAPRRAIVKSAGNEGAANHHAISDPPIPVGGSLSITFSVPGGDMRNRHMECWYNGTTSLDVTLAAPGIPPPVSAPVHEGGSFPFVTNPLALGANQVLATIASNPLDVENGDKQITVDFVPPAGVAIPNGTYTITFTNVGTAPATVHCWLNRSAIGEPTPVFTSNRRRSHTISIPGTSASVITVGSYAAEKFTTDSGAITDVGDLADSSSRGPTRTGAQKPDIAAPGVAITAARANSVAGCCCDCCYTFYVDKNGTSMAAPHVTGVIALMFQRNRTLDAAAIRTALTSTARNPASLVLPDFDWGFGKVDASAAVAAVPGAPDGSGDARHVPAQAPSTIRPGLMHDRSLLRRLQHFQEQVLQLPAGHLWAAIISRHFDEVLRLVNTNRRVATAWHRNGGPAMVRAALTLLEDEPADIVIPETVGESPLAGQLDRIFESWRRYGSTRLVADIDQYRAAALALPGRSLGSILTDGAPLS